MSHLRYAMGKRKTELKADFALVCDTELFAPDLPTLCVRLRGLVYTEIEAVGAKTDLHSGMYGGAAPGRSRTARRSRPRVARRVLDAPGPFAVVDELGELLAVYERRAPA